MEALGSSSSPLPTSLTWPSSCSVVTVSVLSASSGCVLSCSSVSALGGFWPFRGFSAGNFFSSYHLYLFCSEPKFWWVLVLWFNLSSPEPNVRSNQQLPPPSGGKRNRGHVPVVFFHLQPCPRVHVQLHAGDIRALLSLLNPQTVSKRTTPECLCTPWLLGGCVEPHPRWLCAICLGLV